MTTFADILPNRATLHTDADAATVVRDVPKRRAVCLLLDAEDRPVQVLAWANPRVGMKRRLAEPVEGEKTRRVNYGELVRSVLWQAVDSEFESDVIHAAVVRAAFPLRAGELLKFAQPWFLHVDPAAEFPRWTRVERPGNGGISIGPLPDRPTANRVIEVLEDLFDLCRYYHVLVEAPRGKACAYKDMGRCPAPCDGSVPMEAYRRRIAESAGVLLRPGGAGELVAEIEREMKEAAGQLRFEAAKTLKARLEKARELIGPDLAWAGPVERIAIVTAQPGSAEGEAKVFLLTLGGVEEVGTFGEGKLAEAVDAVRRRFHKSRTFASDPHGNNCHAECTREASGLEVRGRIPREYARDDDSSSASIASGNEPAPSRSVAEQPPSVAFDPLAFGPVMRHLFGDAKRRSRFCRIEELSESWLAERVREWKVVPTPSSAGSGDAPQTGG